MAQLKSEPSEIERTALRKRLYVLVPAWRGEYRAASAVSRYGHPRSGSFRVRRTSWVNCFVEPDDSIWVLDVVSNTYTRDHDLLSERQRRWLRTAVRLVREGRYKIVAGWPVKIQKS